MLTRRLGLLASAFAFGGRRRRLRATRTIAAQPDQRPQGQGRQRPPAVPADTPLGPVDTAARWAYIQDFDTGATLLEKQADEEMPPSSMTKLMTMYLVYDQLKQGRLKLEDELPVTEKAWRMQGSKMFVQIGSTVKVEDLIRGVIVQSGNDAAIVLAEAIGGSEEQFAEKMNAKAKELGLTHSFFKNCTGWPDPEQHMSAATSPPWPRRIIRDFPEYYHYDAEKSFRYNGIEQGNRNPMVQKGTADGLKTGHTDAGGYGLVASSKRNGRRVILVLNGMTSMHERAEEAERLMDWAFFNFEDVTLFTAGDVIEQVPVWLGTERTVPLVAGRDVIVTMPRNWRQKASVKVSLRRAADGPGRQGRHAGQADGHRRGRSAPGRAAAGRRRRAPAWAAGARHGGAVEIRDRHVSRDLTQGRFITLEGGEGAGKTTQSALLAEALTQRRRAGAAHPRTRRLARRRTVARHSAGRRRRLGAAGGDPAAFRRARGACREDHPAGAGRGKLGGLRPVLSTPPWRIRAMARAPTVTSSPNRSGCSGSRRT